MSFLESRAWIAGRFEDSRILKADAWIVDCLKHECAQNLARGIWIWATASFILGSEDSFGRPEKCAESID